MASQKAAGIQARIAELEELIETLRQSLPGSGDEGGGLLDSVEAAVARSQATGTRLREGETPRSRKEADQLARALKGNKRLGEGDEGRAAQLKQIEEVLPRMKKTMEDEAAVARKSGTDPLTGLPYDTDPITQRALANKDYVDDSEDQLNLERLKALQGGPSKERMISSIKKPVDDPTGEEYDTAFDDVDVSDFGPKIVEDLVSNEEKQKQAAKLMAPKAEKFFDVLGLDEPPTDVLEEHEGFKQVMLDDSDEGVGEPKSLAEMKSEQASQPPKAVRVLPDREKMESFFKKATKSSFNPNSKKDLDYMAKIKSLLEKNPLYGDLPPGKFAMKLYAAG